MVRWLRCRPRGGCWTGSTPSTCPRSVPRARWRGSGGEGAGVGCRGGPGPVRGAVHRLRRHDHGRAQREGERRRDVEEDVRVPSVARVPGPPGGRRRGGAGRAAPGGQCRVEHRCRPRHRPRDGDRGVARAGPAPPRRPGLPAGAGPVGLRRRDAYLRRRLPGGGRGVLLRLSRRLPNQGHRRRHPRDGLVSGDRDRRHARGGLGRGGHRQRRPVRLAGRVSADPPQGNAPILARS